ncbi:MAG: extensin family protein [Alphaproteobacteria bacterium]|nr:extensin family protein [Alphaproteobacteria bacterium]
MGQRLNLSFATALTFAAFLSACSTGVEKPYFRTEGVATPVSNCSVDPQSLGRAEPVADFTDPSGCGARRAYRVYDVSGISFSQPALIRCELADTLAEWIAGTVQPRAKAIYGQKIASFKVVASYSCRPRNGKSGAKLSEHGMANAIDIAGFTLQDGREINVERDWYSGPADNRTFLRAIRSEACGPFHTVLGPGADIEHRDHFHLDLQRERGGGPYCR